MGMRRGRLPVTKEEGEGGRGGECGWEIIQRMKLFRINWQLALYKVKYAD